MNSSPLTRHPLNPDLRINRILISAFTVLAIGLTLAIIALSTTTGSSPATPTADRAQTLIHFYGNGTPPSTHTTRPQTPSREAPSQHFYGLQP